MPEPQHLDKLIQQPKDRIFVALDVPDADTALEIVDSISDLVGGFKLGLQLFSKEGPEFVRNLAKNHRVFLDLKFHDIPNTVAMASVEATRLGVWMFNVHASGGREMMMRAREAVDQICQNEGFAVPKIIAVTVLTSSDDDGIREVGIQDTVQEQVRRLARVTNESGLDGVVASSNEAAMLRAEIAGEKFLIVTPGIRMLSATNDDQKRVNTFGGALAAGSDFVVIGRPIVQAKDRRRAVQDFVSEILDG